MSRWLSFSLMLGLVAFCLSAQAASSSGTAIPPVTQIVNSSGAVWTVSSGVVFKNGSTAGYTASVIELLYRNGTIYQENSAGGWWSWTGSTWALSSNPLGSGATKSGASASGTTIPAATQIIDTNGNAWTLSGGEAMLNGKQAAYASGVTLILYYNSSVYIENGAAWWFVWNGSGWTSANNPLVANAACGSTPSGSTVTQTVSTTSGSSAATTTQCPYGGTQPTKTTVTQVQLCTNGTLANQGSPVTTTVNSGNPTCNAAAACGSTPSGSTVTQTVSTTSGSTAATTTQCPNGGTQPTKTTVTQVQLCTNGTLANQGPPVTTTVNSGSPTCNAASVQRPLRFV